MQMTFKIVCAVMAILGMASGAAAVGTSTCDSNPMICGVIPCCPTDLLPSGYYCAFMCAPGITPFEEALAAKSIAAPATPAPVAEVAVSSPAASDPCGPFPCGMAMACCPTVFTPLGFYCALACFTEEQMAPKAVAAPAPKVVAAPKPVAAKAPVTSAVATVASDPCDGLKCGMTIACCPSVFSPLGYYCALICPLFDVLAPKPQAPKIAAPTPVVAAAPVAAVAVSSPAASDPCGPFPCGMAMACCPTVFTPLGFYCALACFTEEQMAPKSLAAPAPKAVAVKAPVTSSVATVATDPCDGLKCGMTIACCPSIFSPLGYYCALICPLFDPLAPTARLAVKHKIPAPKAIAAPAAVAVAAPATSVSSANTDPCQAFTCGMALACCPSIFSPIGYYCSTMCIAAEKESAASVAAVMAATPAPVAAASPAAAPAASVSSANTDPCDGMKCGMTLACCPSMFSPIGYYCSVMCIAEEKESAASVAAAMVATPVPVAAVAAAPAAAPAVSSANTDPCGAFPCGMALACCPSMFSPIGYYCSTMCIAEDKVSAASVAAVMAQNAPTNLIADAFNPVSAATSSSASALVLAVVAAISMVVARL